MRSRQEQVPHKNKEMRDRKSQQERTKWSQQERTKWGGKEQMEGTAERRGGRENMQEGHHSGCVAWDTCFAYCS